jgi:hypothetical protein
MRWMLVNNHAYIAVDASKGRAWLLKLPTRVNGAETYKRA